MRQYLIASMGILCIALMGCEEQQVDLSPDQKLIDAKLVESVNNLAIENAIVSQHTLFPYHFVQNSPELNELGQRDLAVLADRFLENAGPLNIRKGSVPAELYEARVNHVVDTLKEAGVEAERITISDGMPGGSGMPSENVLRILEKAEEAPAAGAGTMATTDTSASGRITTGL